MKTAINTANFQGHWHEFHSALGQINRLTVRHGTGCVLEGPATLEVVDKHATITFPKKVKAKGKKTPARKNI